MKKILKNKIFLVLITAIICITVTVYATGEILASNITYNDTTVEGALNDLYNKATEHKVCMLISGTKDTVGAKYACDPGDGVIRNFYILALSGNNVKMIMEKNLLDDVENVVRRMSQSNAIHYFDQGQSGYSIKQSWTNVSNIDLPAAQDIANAGGISGFNIDQATELSYFGTTYGTDNKSNTSNRTSYKWLYNYLYECISKGGCDYEHTDANYPWGYWTKDTLASDSTKGWIVNRGGVLAPTPDDNGIRPVITISKNKLAG